MLRRGVYWDRSVNYLVISIDYNKGDYALIPNCFYATDSNVLIALM